jgi:RIO kinase 2
MTSTSHPNAQFYFERDVKCIQTFFSKRFGLIFEGAPCLETDVDSFMDLDKEVKASGFLKGEDMAAIDEVA